jgi:hypothetical protein
MELAGGDEIARAVMKSDAKVALTIVFNRFGKARFE